MKMNILIVIFGVLLSIFQASNAYLSLKNPSDLCPKNGKLGNVLLPHRNDCNKFWQCSNGVAILQKCPETLEFNARLKVCDWPENSGCESIKTTPRTNTTTVQPTTTEKTTPSTNTTTSSTITTEKTTPTTNTTTASPITTEKTTPSTNTTTARPETTPKPAPTKRPTKPGCKWFKHAPWCRN